jgi:hypothetical protein
MKAFSLFSMLGRDGFTKMREMLAEHGDVFKRGGHGAHDKFHGNPPGTRGNQLYRMVMRERRYQQSLLNIGIDLRKSTK